MLSKDKVTLIDFVSPSDRYFHSLFKFSPQTPEVLVTGIHAPYSTADERTLWKELKDDSTPTKTPWMVVGDLNEVVNQFEKMGEGLLLLLKARTSRTGWI